MEVIVA